MNGEVQPCTDCAITLGYFPSLDISAVRNADSGGEGKLLYKPSCVVQKMFGKSPSGQENTHNFFLMKGELGDGTMVCDEDSNF